VGVLLDLLLQKYKTYNVLQGRVSSADVMFDSPLLGRRRHSKPENAPSSYPTKLHPEQTVGQEEAQAVRVLPPQEDNLMSQGDELKLQRRAAANTERGQGNESGQNRDHAPRRIAVARENPQSFSTVHSFEMLWGRRAKAVASFGR
jgi:hypothetical protein